MTRAKRFAWEERAVRAASALCAWLPRGLVLRLGRALGRLLGDLDRRHIEVTRDNLRRAFPEWHETRVRRTARDVYAHFGLVVGSCAKWSDPPSQRAAVERRRATPRAHPN